MEKVEIEARLKSSLNMFNVNINKKTKVGSQLCFDGNCHHKKDINLDKNIHIKDNNEISLIDKDIIVCIYTLNMMHLIDNITFLNICLEKFK